VLAVEFHTSFAVVLPTPKDETRNEHSSWMGSGGADEASSIKEKRSRFSPKAC